MKMEKLKELSFQRQERLGSLLVVDFLARAWGVQPCLYARRRGFDGADRGSEAAHENETKTRHLALRQAMTG